MLDTMHTDLIGQIHATSIPTVIEFAGAGSAALWQLHAVAGSSRTILEATDRYAPESMRSLLGRLPEQFVSRDTAVAMAWAAYRRACDLRPGPAHNGVGCTATIATDRTKRGNHGCWIAVANQHGVTTYGVTLTKGLRDRIAEEEVVSALILRALAHARGIPNEPPLSLHSEEQLFVESVAHTDILTAFLTGTYACVQYNGDLTYEPVALRGVTLLSGSYNPVHDGHRALLSAALASTGQPGYYELSVVNADKPALPYTTILHRSQQFIGEPRLVLTRAPRFIDKAALFPDSTFVLGYDTAVRLLDPKYYGIGGIEAALRDIAQHGCRFLVVGRTDATGTFRQLHLEDIPESCRSLFVLFDEERFRRDISSSSIRAGLLRLGET
jgi:hypothetical protein